MKKVSKKSVIYSFSPKHRPVEYVEVGELVLLETEDALGGQIDNENDSLGKLDWSKVDGATGPVFIKGSEPGDTLVVEILDVKVEEEGFMVTVVKQGILKERDFRSCTKIVKIRKGYVEFSENIRIRTRPMIGTIGVAPASGEIPSGSLGKHGGNMDSKRLTAGTRLYLPVFVEGALFAAGDLHAVQTDGELSVSAVEVAGEVLLRFNLIKRRRPMWPLLETQDQYALLACGDTLDEAAAYASEAGVKAYMQQYDWAFEEAYMFGSLAIDLEINQVVDPKKGIRAVLPKHLISLENLLT